MINIKHLALNKIRCIKNQNTANNKNIQLCGQKHHVHKWSVKRTASQVLATLYIRGEKKKHLRKHNTMNLEMPLGHNQITEATVGTDSLKSSASQLFGIKEAAKVININLFIFLCNTLYNNIYWYTKRLHEE